MPRGSNAVLALVVFIAASSLAPTTLLAQCTDTDGDGYFFEEGCGTARDCNDGDPNSNPGAIEACDGFDNDCDQQVDNDPTCANACGMPDRYGSNVRVTDSPGNTSFPSLVWAGTQYGVAWSDSSEGTHHIYFARLNTDGVLIGSILQVTEGEGPEYRPSLVWTGTRFAVSWTDYRSGTGQIYFVQISALGVKLGAEVGLTVGPSYSVESALVWNGGGFGVVWKDSRHSLRGRAATELYFARLDPSGNVLGPHHRVTVNAGGPSEPSLVWTGAEYGLAWHDRRDLSNSEIYFTRLDANGSELGDDKRITDDLLISELASLVWSGSEYGLVWQENYQRVYFARLASAGDMLGARLQVDDDTGDSGFASLTWTGEEFSVSWHDNSAGNWEICFARVNTDSQLIGSTLRITNSLESSARPQIVWRGGSFGVIWMEYQWPASPYDLFFVELRCDCSDTDGDGVSWCSDCDDGSENVYPTAPDICDGLNNDCNHPAWPGLENTNDHDDDGDSYSECDGDCDDVYETVHPGAPQLCDGLNNDCSHPLWPALNDTNEADDDGDGISECAGDCDDAHGDTYPQAPQLCDGVNNDCDANWPVVPAGEIDDDGDDFFECQGDCNDGDSAINPAATEQCNSIDDDCDDLTDEDELGEDTDADGVHNLCDNCREAVNPDQADTDQDAYGNACDNCVFVSNDQADFDNDDRGDVCDNCPESFNPYQDDLDDDAVGDVCDNCFDTFNPSQSDVDADAEGDHCDLDDGLIYITFKLKNKARWQEEVGYLSWNAYKGDLAVLTASGFYTQLPGSNDLAGRNCGLLDPLWQGVGTPDPGETAFFLATGVNAQGESDLGTDSAGETRPNDTPCP